MGDSENDNRGRAWRRVDTRSQFKSKHTLDFDGFDNDDILIMTLNIRDKELIYYTYNRSQNKNDKIEACRIQEIHTDNVKYCLAVCLTVKASVSLMDFEITHTTPYMTSEKKPTYYCPVSIKPVDIQPLFI